MKLKNIRKIGNIENVKKDHRNKRGSIVGGNKCKNLKGYTRE